MAVIVCNQVCAKVDIAPFFGTAGGFSDKVPIGGHIMAHSTQTRLALRKGSNLDKASSLVLLYIIAVL